MISPKCSTNHSSSFLNHKNYLRHKFHKSKFLTQELFKETGYTSDVPSMAGSSRTGFWMRLTIVEPRCCLSFLRLFSKFLVLASKITFDCDISLMEFFVATTQPFCFVWLLQYWSSSCSVSNSTEGGDVKSKGVCYSWLMIKTF